MASIFARLTEQQEKAADSWQTKRLKDYTAEVSGLERVVAFIEKHYLASDRNNWSRRINLGSVTFQNRENPHKVISVFIDDGNRLAQKYGLSLSDNPIAVGIELAAWQEYERHAIRAELQSSFERYQNPENGERKIYLAPSTNHPLDILFFNDGFCDVGDLDLGTLRATILRGIPDATDVW